MQNMYGKHIQINHKYILFTKQQDKNYEEPFSKFLNLLIVYRGSV